MKPDKVESEYYDYKRIFNENIKSGDENNNNNRNAEDNNTSGNCEKKHVKEKKYVATFLAQSVICLIIIGSIIITKYANPKTFVSVSSALNGLYQNNITLSDLNKLIDEKILGNDALAAFFNMNGVDAEEAEEVSETEEPTETEEQTEENSD